MDKNRENIAYRPEIKNWPDDFDEPSKELIELMVKYTQQTRNKPEKHPRSSEDARGGRRIGREGKQTEINEIPEEGKVVNLKN